MKKAFLIVVILFVSVMSTACINNFAVQELNNKAKSYLDNGDYENAISRLKSSLDIDSTIFETHYNLGIAYTQAEKYDEAIKTFESAIKLKPGFSDTYYSKAVAEENYAKGIIDGTLKDDDNKKEDSDLLEISKKQKVLTNDEKTLVSKLLNDSIASYQTYLQKSSQATDKQEVEEKIEYLKTMLTKYSTQE